VIGEETRSAKQRDNGGAGVLPASRRLAFRLRSPPSSSTGPTEHPHASRVRVEQQQTLTLQICLPYGGGVYAAPLYSA